MTDAAIKINSICLYDILALKQTLFGYMTDAGIKNKCYLVIR